MFPNVRVPDINQCVGIQGNLGDTSVRAVRIRGADVDEVSIVINRYGRYSVRGTREQVGGNAEGVVIGHSGRVVRLELDVVITG